MRALNSALRRVHAANCSNNAFASFRSGVSNPEGRQYPVNAAVKVTIDQALPVLSPVYMFNDKVSDEEVRVIWLKRYGVAPRGAREVDYGT